MSSAQLTAPLRACAFVVELLRDAAPGQHPVRIYAQPILVFNFTEAST